MAPINRRASAAPDASHPALSCRPMQMLVRIARQSRLGDPEGCSAVLAMLSTSRLVRGRLQSLLASLGLTEAKFQTLITLYALDPEPSTPADLAGQVQISRAAMTDALDALGAKGLVRCERGQSDRRTRSIHLTGAGRDLVESSVRPFLTAVGRCAESLSAAERASLGRACDHLYAHFQDQPV